jgi:hypothetical protein
MIDIILSLLLSLKRYVGNDRSERKLDETIIAWQGKFDQTDDILVRGIKI